MEQATLGTRPRILLSGANTPIRTSPFEKIILLVILGIVGFIAYTAYQRVTGFNAKVATPPQYVPAVRKTLTSQVSTTGTVQATQQVNLTFDVGNTGTAKIKEFLVGLGDTVKQGQPLARLDDTVLQQAVRSAQAALDSSNARYNALVNPSPDQVASSQQSISSATAQVSTAQNNLNNVLSGPTTTTIQSAQQAVTTARSQLQSANDAVTRAQANVTSAQNDLNSASASMNTACASTGGSTTTTVSKTPTANTSASSTASTTACDNARASVVKAQGALASAQSSLNSGALQTAVTNAQNGVSISQQKLVEAQAPAKQSDIDASNASLSAAKAGLASANAKYNTLLNPPDDQVLPLLSNVESARDNLATAQQNLAAATITAPFDGQISQLTGNVGTQIVSSTVVFILLNPKLIRIDANVDQSDIGNLKVGQAANVTFDALQGRAYTATVTAIGLTPTIQQGVVTYVVSFGMDTSAIPAGTPIPAPGMTAALTVQTSRTDNALVIPTRSIKKGIGGRGSTVTLQTASGTEVRPVTTGATDSQTTQITNGLSDGDMVLVSSPTTTATPAAGGFNFGGGGGPGR